VLNNFILAEIV